MLNRSISLVCLLGILLLGPISQAQKFNEYFIDSTDKALDVSGFLNSAGGFMPVPLIITEPAVGFGMGLGAVFFHNKKIREGEKVKGELPPIMSMAAGAYTTNGTAVGILGHQGSYHKDRFRVTAAVGVIDANLAFYGAGIIEEEQRYDFNMNGYLFFSEFLFRPKKDIPFFTGLNYLFFKNDATFKTGIDIPELENLTTELNIGGLNWVLYWDTRNNTFTPTTGIMSALELGRFDEKLGGETNYSNISNRTYYYLPIVKNKLFSGYRFNWHSKSGDVPFYELPSISLRGIEMMRYQNHHVVTVETEWRWQVVNRWSVVGFIGMGNTAYEPDEFESENQKVAGGAGFRYLIAKDYGIHAGIDVAKGPEIWAWYLTIGSNWFR